MFDINDWVKYQETEQVGKVIGYGHEIMDNVYTITFCKLFSLHLKKVIHLLTYWD